MSKYQNILQFCFSDLSVLQCVVPDQPVADYTIGLSINGVGYATWIPGVRKHTRMSRSFKSISPNTGSIHGGNIVTLSIVGATKSTNAEITIGGALCPIIERTEYTMKCKAPPKGSKRQNIHPLNASSLGT